MNTKWVMSGLVIALLCPLGMAAAEEKEPLFVLSLGGVGEWGFPGGKLSRGPSAAVEFDLIKEWVEVEVGAAKVFRRGNSEWEAEVVFRKPFTLSKTTELAIGLGPVWSQAKGESGKWGTTFSADFMFWSSPERKYGWFVEPTYSFISGNERSLGVSVGFLIGIH